MSDGAAALVFAYVEPITVACLYVVVMWGAGGVQPPEAEPE